MKSEPNDICYCPSGRLYKDCHMKLDNAIPEKRVAASHDLYLSDWRITAKHFQENGYYEWMASILSTAYPKLVLDIGCGTGEGILELVKRFNCEIISIEENLSCIKAASELLKSNGIEVEPIERLNFDPIPPQNYSYTLSVYPNKLQHKAQVTIIQSDWLASDIELLNFLKVYTFDAVTIWLVGSHRIHSACIDIPRMKDAAEYRLIAQNKTYEVADTILRPGGILQVVDRGGEPNTPELVEDVIRSHKDQASVTSLEVFDLQFRPYCEASNGIPMVLSPGLLGKIGNEHSRALVSICSKKP